MNETVSIGYPAKFEAHRTGIFSSGIGQSTIKWRVIEEGTGKQLKYYATFKDANRGIRNSNELTDFSQGDTMQIDCIPETWPDRVQVIAYTCSPSDGKFFTVNVTKTEVGRFIALVRKLETAYPTWTGERTLNSLRKLAGYDELVHQKMLDLGPSEAPKPNGKSILRQEDIEELKNMLSHTPDIGVKGTAKDAYGYDVAMGHVLTGISAGQHRDKEVDLANRLAWSDYEVALDHIWESVLAGDVKRTAKNYLQGAKKAGEVEASYILGGTFDNLFAFTISGDLGQSAVFVFAGKTPKFIGDKWSETEATYDELVGDIDGFLIGANLNQITSGKKLLVNGENGIRLSEVLQKYYSSYGTSKLRAQYRFVQFSEKSIIDELPNQCHEFADTYIYYVYKKEGYIALATKAVPANLEPHLQGGLAEFWEWLENNRNQETLRNEGEAQAKQKVSDATKTQNEVSSVSWGETSGIYPTRANLYKPKEWDSAKKSELLKARAAINEVGKRGQKVKRKIPGNSPIEEIVKPYHFIENFPPVDTEISDVNVKWFFLSKFSNQPQSHPSTGGMTELVKTYGPFYNAGGGDAPKGDIYIHFYRKKNPKPQP